MVSWRETGGVAAVFLDFDRQYPDPSVGLFLHEGVQDGPEVGGDPFAGTVGDAVHFEGFGGGLNDPVGEGIIFIENAGVIEMVFQPLAEELQFAEVDDETIFVEFFAAKGEGETPVVAMDLCTVPIVLVLAMGEGNVVVGFATSQHGSFQWLAIKVSISGASGE